MQDKTGIVHRWLGDFYQETAVMFLVGHIISSAMLGLPVSQILVSTCGTYQDLKSA